VLNDGKGGSLEIGTQKDLVHYMMLGIALNHECVIESVEGRLTFNGNSPDEITLLKQADEIGYSCYKFTSDSIHLNLGVPGREAEEVKFELLN
jgi:hypothetical protein